MISVPTIDIQYYFNEISSYFIGHYPVYFNFAKSFIGLIIGLSVPISLFLLIAIIYSVEGIKRIRNKEDKIYNPKKIEPAYTETSAQQGDIAMTNRWKKILEHMEVGGQNDWKQAILEADVMLDDLLTKLGYRGESLGEKLKRVVIGDFKNLDQAWEAHKIRNNIAHDGSSFELNKIEAQRVIGLYRQVFEEFYHIS